MSERLSPAKAVVAAVVAVLGALIIGLEDQSLSVAEYLISASAGITAFASVYWTPNKPLS